MGSKYVCRWSSELSRRSSPQNNFRVSFFRSSSFFPARFVLLNSVYAVIRVESCRLHYTGCVCSVAGLVGRPGMSDVRRRCGVYGNVGGEGGVIESLDAILISVTSDVQNNANLCGPAPCGQHDHGTGRRGGKRKEKKPPKRERERGALPCA